MISCRTTASDPLGIYERSMKLSAFILPKPAQPRAAPAAAAPLSKKDEMAARKLQEAKDAVATLAAVRTKTSDDQKARAAQKVKELKARLQALKMIYAGDPRKLARAAAQIARELAGAVKSYVGAGGSAAELGSDAAGDGSNAPQASAPVDDSNVAAPPADADAKLEAKAATDTASLVKPEAEKSPAERARNKADEDFRNDVRDLARALKAALRRKDPRHRDEDDQRSGEQALAAVDQAVGALPIAEAPGAAAAAL